MIGLTHEKLLECWFVAYEFFLEHFPDVEIAQCMFLENAKLGVTYYEVKSAHNRWTINTRRTAVWHADVQAWVRYSVTLDQEELLAEDYRQRLRLRTWYEQAEYAADMWQRFSPFNYRDPRGSGRTTRGLLRAIAGCTVKSIQTLVIDCGPENNRSHCIDMARQLVGRLGLMIMVVPDAKRRQSRDWITYRDHYNPAASHPPF